MQFCCCWNYCVAAGLALSHLMIQYTCLLNSRMRGGWGGGIIGWSCQKYHFCRDKYVFVATKQSFVMTKVCLLRQKFCCDIIMFVVTKLCLLWQKHVFVATNIILSREKFCHDKHTFAVTKDVFCHETFVATKMLLVAAPTNDRGRVVLCGWGRGVRWIARVQEVVETEGGWDTCGSLRVNTKPSTLHHQSVTWRREVWKEEALDDLPWKDEGGPSSVRWTLEPFQRQRWGNFWEMGWSTYNGLFCVHRYHFELNQTELNLYGQ